MIHGIQIHTNDNVVTLMENANAGSVEVVGESAVGSLKLREAIDRGHKAALHAIPAGGDVIKYGIAIGTATQKIQAGAWVHLHNCRSGLDQRSSTLDLKTGAPTDTSYS